MNFANQIRYDGLSQEVAFKNKSCGQQETIEDRQGKVELFYDLEPSKPVRPRKPTKPRANASTDKIEKYDKDVIEFERQLYQYEKEHVKYLKEYREKLDRLIVTAQHEDDIEFTVLKLTNKSIARDAGFPTLFEIFDNRYLETKDEIEKKLALWQFQALFELCDAYQPFSASEEVKPNYNDVISRLKKNGFKLKSLEDKKRIKEHIQEIINSEIGAFKTLDKAISFGLLKKSESNESFFARVKVDLSFYQTDEIHNNFKKIYEDSGNTFLRFNSHSNVVEHDEFRDFNEEDFYEKERDLNKEEFLTRLLDDEISFKEILNYYSYLNEYLPFITMHKTKGGEIENVLVVLDEYFWTQYNFKNAFLAEIDQSKKEKNANLIYVACTRAKTNLRCVRLVKDEEEENLFKTYFSNAIKFELT